MKAILIIACVCLALVVAEEDDRIVQSITTAFSISVEDAQKCVNRTQVTVDDFRAVLKEMEHPDADPLNRMNALKATCTMACAAQLDGMMIGAKFQAAKLHAQIERENRVPDDLKPAAHKLIDTCCDAVKDETEACEAVLKQMQCMKRES